MRLNTSIAAAALALSMTAVVAADRETPVPGAGADISRLKTPQDPEKPSEWPKLTKRESDRARAAAKQFRKKQARLHQAATELLKGMGAGVAPVLIPLISDRAQNINRYIFEVLDHVVDESHAALLAREAARKSVACRRYVARTLAGVRDAAALPALKRMLNDKDADIAFFAALGALAAGDQVGVDGVLAVARQRWTEHRALIAATLTPSRSDAAGMLVWAKIEEARPTDQMAGLRLLRYLATKGQRGRLRSYLESADFAVKREAINTARALHGEAALEKLSSFQAINLAKQWLEKL